MKKEARELAALERGWWMDHHRRNYKGVLDKMAQLYEGLYGMGYEEAVECVKYRIGAAKEHDEAERLEDAKKQKEADVHWKRAEQLLEQHFKILIKSVEGP